MNGRVYDPVLGRFLSADPHVDDPDDSQAFNRYSYVSNNPLSYTDPSGYFKLGDALKIVGSLVIGYFTAGLATPWLTALNLGKFAMAVAQGAAFGFGSSFSGSLLNGGSIGDAFKAGVIGAVQGAAAAGVGQYFNGLTGSKLLIEGGRAVAHGVVGGLAAEAMGGEFRHGFYAAAAGSAAGSIAGAVIGNGSEPWKIAARTTIAAVAGGTASVLGGGKFANGAFTAAFQHLVNHESSYLEDVGETFSGYALGFFEGFSGLSAGDGSMGSTVGDQGRSVGIGIGRAVQFLNLAKGGIALARSLGSRLSASTAAAAARRATITVNAAAGAAAEVRAAEALVAEGYQILGSQVTVRTSQGLRVIDHLVRSPSGQIIAIEVKSGNAVRSAAQLGKDALMGSEGAVIVGKNAPDFLQGTQRVIQTIERRF